MMYKNLQNISFNESAESSSQPSIYDLFTYHCFIFMGSKKM